MGCHTPETGLWFPRRRVVGDETCVLIDGKPGCSPVPSANELPLLISHVFSVGYRLIKGCGSYLQAIVASVLVRMLPLALEIVGFGSRSA